MIILKKGEIFKYNDIIYIADMTINTEVEEFHISVLRYASKKHSVLLYVNIKDIFIFDKENYPEYYL